jgi:CRISPR/Cas system-associated exonuclease Cas4 (RecB family)
MIDCVKAIYDEKAKKIQRWPVNCLRASSMGYYVPQMDGCERRGVLERTRWQEKELHDIGRELRYQEGNHQERIVLRDLSDAGIQVIEQQGAFTFPEQDIQGHLDGVILEADGSVTPLEIKSMSDFVFDSVHTAADLKKKSWTKAYIVQLQLYMLAKGKDRAILLCKAKGSGQLRQIEMTLDYELTECVLKCAERINAHIKAKTLPDRIADVEVCKECPMRLVCAPGQKWGEELVIGDDPLFEGRLEKYFELAGPRDEYDKNYEVIKSRVKATANGKAIKMVVGKFLVEGKPDSRGAMRLTITKP